MYRKFIFFFIYDHFEYFISQKIFRRKFETIKQLGVTVERAAISVPAMFSF